MTAPSACPHTWHEHLCTRCRAERRAWAREEATDYPVVLHLNAVLHGLQISVAQEICKDLTNALLEVYEIAEKRAGRPEEPAYIPHLPAVRALVFQIWRAPYPSAPGPSETLGALWLALEALAPEITDIARCDVEEAAFLVGLTKRDLRDTKPPTPVKGEPHAL